MHNIRCFADRSPRIAESAWVDPTALVIGEVDIAAHCSIWPMAVLRGDVQAIRIGERSNIQDGSVLHVSHDSRHCPGGRGLSLGRGVTVGHRVILHACTIGDHCLVGMGSVVLDGAVLRPWSMLGAGSLVPAGKELEGGHLWMGTPALRVRPLRESEVEYLVYAADHYVRLAQRHRASLRGEPSE